MGYTESSGSYNELKILLTYCTSEKEWKELKNLNKKRLEKELDIKADLSSFGEKIANADEKEEDIKKKLDEITSKLSENFLGTAFSYFLGLIRDSIGDTLQKLANNITFYNGDITYSYDQLNSNAGSKYNEYTKVSKEMKKGNDSQIVYDIKEIDSKEEEDKRFNEETEIPVIMMDLYNVAAGNIPMFDINFLENNEGEHPDEWLTIRNFFSSIIHFVIYLVAASMILMLIYTGIQIVMHSNDSPEKKKKSKDAMERFTVSIVMLVGSIVICALCVYGNSWIFDTIKLSDSGNEGPIRVYSREAGYSFSTTITGYFRYMAEIQGVNRCLEKGSYTFAYIAVAFVNLLLAAFMFIRVIIIMFLACAGPIIAGCKVWDIKTPISFKTWTKLYVSLAIIPVLFTIVYKIILYVSF